MGFLYAARYFALDLTPMIVFLVVFLVTKNIYLATGTGIGIGAIQVAWQLARKEPVGRMQWASLGLVLVFGTATLLTHNPHFIMFKPTATNLVLGAVMLKPGWMERYVPPQARAAAARALWVFGFIWAGLMFFTAAANFVLISAASPETWAKFNLFFPPISMSLLFLIQHAVVRAKSDAPAPAR
jgi:intracellular septation protein A